MKKALIILGVLVLITLPTFLPYFNAKFFYTQDYIFIARLQQMSTSLSSGQFPVRWAPDLRYGEPIFNFYAPLPYYIGAIIHTLGLNFIWVAKILFILSSILSAVAIYILVNKLFGQRAAILAAFLYTYAPYRAVDMYVRGSLSETWAFVFFPLIFLSFLNLAKELNFKNVGLSALSLTGLFLTHNVTTLMFMPFLFFWWVYLILREKKWKVILSLFSSVVLGFGAAAFFLLPAYFERDFIQTKYLIVGYFNFRAHFVAFSQLFSTFWGYGSSLWGRQDGLSFQIGLVNWAILTLAAIFGIIYRKNTKLLVLLLFLGLSFLFSIFLQHNKSAFIWEAIPSMAFIQFPWRFLAISIFIVSLVGGAITPYLQKKLPPLYFILIIVLFVSTISYFRPKEYADDSFFDKFLKVEIMHQGTDLTKDYLPIWVQTVDGERFDAPKAEKGEIKVSNLTKNPTTMNFSADVISGSLIEVPISYFPGWEVRANDQFIAQVPPSKMGLIRFKLPKGNFRIKVELKDTPIRTIGNTISVFSLLIIAVFFALSKKDLLKKKYFNA